MGWRLKIATSIVGFSAFLMSAPRTSYAAPPTDACSLLTPAQVGPVLGMSVSAGGSLSPNLKAMCGWPAPGGAVPPKRVLVTITKVNVFAGAKMGLAGKAEVITFVSGVGDEAFYDVHGSSITFFARKGDFAFSVRVYGFSPDESKAKEKELAQDVLARL